MTTTVGKRGRRKAYSDEQLIEFLQNAAEYHDKESLSWIEYEQYRATTTDLPVPQTFAARFGTWHKGIEAAGLRPAVSGRNREKFSDTDINVAIWEATEYHKTNTLTIAQYEEWLKITENPAPSARWVIIKRGTWLDACLQANLDLNVRQTDAMYSDSEIVRHLQVAASELKSRTLTIAQYEAYRKSNPEAPGSRTVSARCGSWNKANELAGLVPIKAGFDYVNKNRKSH